MRSFNLILYLFLFAPICSAFGWLFNYLSVQLTNITFVNLDTVKSITDIISSVCHGFALISLLLALFLVGLEIIQWLKTDSLWNYIQSVYHTFLLRHFLFQRERVQKISNLEHQTVTTINPIHNGRYTKRYHHYFSKSPQRPTRAKNPKRDGSTIKRRNRQPTRRLLFFLSYSSS